MVKLKQVVQLSVSGVVGTIATTCIYYLGGNDVALQSLIIAIIIDYITGLLSAGYRKQLDSKIGLKGIIKKLSYLFVVAMAVTIDRLTGASGIVRNMIIYFFVSNDCLSIVENLAEMDVALPKKLIEMLNQLKKEQGGDE